MTEPDVSTQSAELKIVVSRDMDVTPQQIWEAWIDPAAIARWWGPAGFTSTVNELDVRTGGRFDVVMHGPDGTDFVNLYLFNDVIPATLLRYTNQGSEEFDLAPFVSVVQIKKSSDLTRVTLTAIYESEKDFRRHIDEFHADEGARDLLKRLEKAAAAKSI